MITITNGANKCTVTNGAYEKIYKKQGYYPVEEVKSKHVETGAEKQEEAADAGYSEEEKYCADLLEKPISNWNKDEVKNFAELKGIDIKGTKNANEAKNVIKAWIAENVEN